MCSGDGGEGAQPIERDGGNPPHQYDGTNSDPVSPHRQALPVKYTYHRNTSVDSIAAGKFGNIRLHGLKGNMNQDQPWIRLSDAVKQPPGGGDSPLFMFSSTCYYFGECALSILRERASTGYGQCTRATPLRTRTWGGCFDQNIEFLPLWSCVVQVSH